MLFDLFVFLFVNKDLWQAIIGHMILNYARYVTLKSYEYIINLELCQNKIEASAKKKNLIVSGLIELRKKFFFCLIWFELSSNIGSNNNSGIVANSYASG